MMVTVTLMLILITSFLIPKYKSKSFLKLIFY